MKKLYLLFFVIILCLVSCKKKTEINRNATIYVQSYPWNIATPEEDSWKSSDRVGVFMYRVNGDDKVFVNGVENIECRAMGQGLTSMFEPVNSEHKIVFPSNSPVYFFAYSPYRAKDQMSEYRIDIDLTDQSDPSVIDYKWGMGNYYTYPMVQFNLAHLMTRVKIHLTSSIYTPQEMEQATVKLINLPTNAIFFLVKFKMVVSNTIGDIQTKVLDQGKSYQAIVFPVGLELLKPKIEVSIAGKKLVCDIYEPEFQSEREYNFTLDLREESIYYAPPINSKRQ